MHPAMEVYMLTCTVTLLPVFPRTIHPSEFSSTVSPQTQNIITGSVFFVRANLAIVYSLAMTCEFSSYTIFSTLCLMSLNVSCLACAHMQFFSFGHGNISLKSIQELLIIFEGCTLTQQESIWGINRH